MADIVSAGLAESCEKNGNSIVLTPVYKGENLLLSDSGDIPFYSEAIAYMVDMTASEVDDEVVYSVFNITKAGAGITRSIADEIKMYGNGKYIVEFEICGNGNGMLRLPLYTSTDYTYKKHTIVLNGSWQKVRYEFDVNIDIGDFVAYGLTVAAADTGLTSFDIKNIKLTKAE